MNCKGCRYHVAHGKQDDGQDVGFCMRMPPTVLPDGKTGLPMVLTDKCWCGEHKRKWFGK